ncbi:helix-turn-helix domain-containing protein [Marinigracilibium pacificum]|uniref:Helix-turn-helix transcriptional regulator n=1 Tax=Marinigracilibium pacificum TaxID=2729599 RepID=A0A848J6A4_9BACT|nr:AraC family transcriptional regulator [Marinigracilibium pacificum]NMM49909.1 helix-turn-helix transcriptional regulator [Marinigracilibium pacificum]
MEKLIHIFKVDESDADKISSSPDDPHNHDFEELLIGIEGELEHFIDFQSEVIKAPYVSFVTKGKVHRVVPRKVNGKCLLWGIRFKSELLPDLTFYLYSLFHNSANIEVNDTRCFKRFVNICELIDEELKQENPELSIVQHLLRALFMMVETEKNKSQDINQNDSDHNVTFSNFLQILEENYRRQEGVEFYAEKLFMSSRNLNIISQKILQQSVSEIIETRKLIEAKNLLASTDMNISEIAYEIGYNEKAYFSKVFKKKSGQTPSEFRKEMRKLI